MNPSTGEFTQDEDGGFFARFRLVPAPTPRPGPTPVPEPTETPEPGTLYSGTYVLSNGERGNFNLVVNRANEASGGGFPTVNTQGFTFQIVSTGQSTITLRIAGSTGSGTVRLTSETGATVATGTITINRRQSFSSASRNFRTMMKLLKR